MALQQGTACMACSCVSGRRLRRGRSHIDDLVEVKCLKSLIVPYGQLCHEVQEFSFRVENAAEKLDQADVFYFKGFGG